ncbi:hypothetical protein TNCV_5042901 [Trichonephila clavipes]|nr:hypothetical protein TNCV_5042901 [Trichonephila clavipes]
MSMLKRPAVGGAEEVMRRDQVPSSFLDNDLKLRVQRFRETGSDADRMPSGRASIVKTKAAPLYKEVQ